jgi:hypothetical protein
MTEAAHFAAEAATEAHFGRGEHLVVWSARRIMAQGGEDYARLALECADSCGPDNAEVFATIYTFLQVLTRASRKPLQFGPPGCTVLTPDERRFLTLVAASQSENIVHFRAHLRWLADTELREELEIATHSLATALKLNDFTLSLPDSIGPMICERDAA